MGRLYFHLNHVENTDYAPGCGAFSKGESFPDTQKAMTVDVLYGRDHLTVSVTLQKSTGIASVRVKRCGRTLISVECISWQEGRPEQC